MLKIGTVTDNVDPQGFRRIQITTQDRGISSSQWLPRVTNFDGDDTPLPIIGTSVVVAEVGGDSTEDIILGVLQTSNTNRPIPDKPAGSNWWYLLESVKYWFNNTFTITSPSSSHPTLSLHQDGTIKASNIFGSVVLSPSGYLTITNPTGTLTMGGTGLDIVSSVPIKIDAPSLLWGGQPLARVGGTDTDGDVTVS
jgi:hypothetical protein